MRKYRKRWAPRYKWRCQANKTTQEARQNLDRGTCIDVERWRANLEALAAQPDWELPKQAQAEGIWQTWQSLRIKEIMSVLPRPKPKRVPEPEPRVKPMANARELGAIKFSRRNESIIRQLALHVRLSPGDSAAILQDPDGVYWLSCRRKLKTGGISFDYKDIWPEVATEMIEAFNSAPKRPRKARRPEPQPKPEREPEYVSNVRYFHGLA
jgi:hypothetical protein